MEWRRTLSKQFRHGCTCSGYENSTSTTMASCPPAMKSDVEGYIAMMLAPTCYRVRASASERRGERAKMGRGRKERSEGNMAKVRAMRKEKSDGRAGKDMKSRARVRENGKRKDKAPASERRNPKKEHGQQKVEKRGGQPTQEGYNQHKK